MKANNEVFKWNKGLPRLLLQSGNDLAGLDPSCKVILVPLIKPIAGYGHNKQNANETEMIKFYVHYVETVAERGTL